MNEQLFEDSLVDISLITDEGFEAVWLLPPERFAEEKSPIILADRVRLDGRLVMAGDAIYLNGEVTAALRTPCARCLVEVDSPVPVPLEAVFARRESVEGDSGGETVTEEEMGLQLYEGTAIDIYPPVRDHIALAAPIKTLCDEDCKGLCPTCGALLNEGKCSCAPQVTGGPFAALRNMKFGDSDT